MKYISFLSLLLLQIALVAQDDLDIETLDIRNQKKDFTYNNAANIELKKLDTLRTYNVDLYETNTPFGIKYTVNGKEITKQKYLDYKKYWNTVDACQPCLLHTYDAADDIMYIAYQYENCLCGKYISYYKGGSKKVEGNFMTNPSNNWENYKNEQFCNRKQGIWKYFLANGNVEKIEEYQNGVLVKVEKGKSEMTPAVNIYNREQNIENEEQGNSEKKKNIFQRLKHK